MASGNAWLYETCLGIPFWAGDLKSLQGEPLNLATHTNADMINGAYEHEEPPRARLLHKNISVNTFRHVSSWYTELLIYA